jgi:hypothetical protein
LSHDHVIAQSSHFTTSHVARPTAASTNPESEAVTPGQSVLTASFATRGSRAQIPSAPPNALVRGFSGRPPVRPIRNSVVSRSTGGPQHSGVEAPHLVRGGLRGMARIVNVARRGEWSADQLTSSSRLRSNVVWLERVAPKGSPETVSRADLVPVIVNRHHPPPVCPGAHHPTEANDQFGG